MVDIKDVKDIGFYLFKLTIDWFINWLIDFNIISINIDVFYD